MSMSSALNRKAKFRRRSSGAVDVLFLEMFRIRVGYGLEQPGLVKKCPCPIAICLKATEAIYWQARFQGSWGAMLWVVSFSHGGDGQLLMGRGKSLLLLRGMKNFIP